MSAELNDILLLIGGIIPDDDIPILKNMGVSAIFGPGTSIKEIADYIRNHVRPKKATSGAS